MLLDDIAAYLQSNGVGIIGTDIFLGQMPETPDNCVALFEYAGHPPEYAYGVDIERPGLQVLVRNKDYSSGRAKCQQIQNLLHNIRNQVINDVHYTSILANQSPESLGRDANGRMEWVQNFSVIKQRE